MRAWVVRRPGPIDDGPLALVERPEPHPGPGELRVRVSVCGVCRTDLHLAEGDLAPRRADVTPGHEIVGVVDELGRCDEVRDRRARRDRVAPPHVRVVPVLPSRRREPLPGARLHRLGRRRGLRRARRRRRGLRVRPARGLHRRRGRTPAVRRDHRLPRPSAAPPSPAADGSASTASAGRPTLRPRWPWPRAPRCTSSPGRPRPAGWRPTWARRGWVTPPRSRPNRSTRRSCSRRPVRSWSPRSPRWTGAARWRWRASTSATSRRCATPTTSSRSASSAASRPTRAMTARDFLAIAAQIPIRVATTPYPLEQADAALRDLAHDRFAGAAVLHLSAIGHAPRRARTCVVACAHAGQLRHRAGGLPPLAPRARRPDRDPRDGRRPGRRAPRRLRAEAELLRPGRRHRALRRRAAAALRASRGARGRRHGWPRQGVLRRGQHPDAGGLDARPQGELLQVHQRDPQRHRGRHRPLRPGLDRRGQRHRRGRRLRAGAGLRRDPAGRRPGVGGVAPRAAAAGGAPGHGRPDPGGRQAPRPAGPRRRLRHADRGRRRAARRSSGAWSTPSRPGARSTSWCARGPRPGRRHRTARRTVPGSP